MDDYDLPGTACHAAIGLGGLLHRDLAALGAVEELARILAGDGPAGEFLCDPSASVVMHEAIVDSRLVAEPMSDVEELATFTRGIAGRLAKIVGEAKAGRYDSSELERMRDFCLALSRRASDHSDQFRAWRY